ncbi:MULTISPECIES: class I SAM-dependent rRNA methyltransferase [Enterococcus]|uniref:SAM-dependent methyltransferase n=1 Tax=Enterococcus alcedinis TaxID=1274384 RepID=A0A917JHU6_9ENTE|nr:class I SAM-dependent rRNA methyltransferase [Enterococcus alcedinis]MBP2102363.1 23S rRNA (cytosine1962-C5)-methyltransferase [Enterococcus alcedinis]GGI65921.1 SAM-dependent methyltransferase [Enterococcus alcedinis]
MKRQLTMQGSKKVRQGYPLIQQEDLVKAEMSTDWVELTGPQGEFLAMGYLGKQNKGIGWVLSHTKQAINEAFFIHLFQVAKEKRHHYYQDATTTAFRLFNGEGDGMGGLIIDLYQDHGVFSWYNETLYGKKKEIVTAFQTVFPEVVGAYEKIRFESTLPESQLLYGEEASEPLLVKENGITFATYLNEGLMTGIFLDQKEVRGALVEGMASGKTVLNMFSYTGAFSVAAAMGGATKTTSVDLAKRSVPKTKEQFLVNGIDPETQNIHVMDTFEYFKYAKRKNLTFDVVVLDPPSFARNKKKTFSVAKNYGELIEDSVDLLNETGTIIASTNAANVSPKQFKQMIESAFEAKNVTFKNSQNYTLPSDFATNPAFPEGDYLKVYCYNIKK